MTDLIIVDTPTFFVRETSPSGAQVVWIGTGFRLVSGNGVDGSMESLKRGKGDYYTEVLDDGPFDKELTVFDSHLKKQKLRFKAIPSKVNSSKHERLSDKVTQLRTNQVRAEDIAEALDSMCTADDKEPSV